MVQKSWNLFFPCVWKGEGEVLGIQQARIKHYIICLREEKARIMGQSVNISSTPLLKSYEYVQISKLKQVYKPKNPIVSISGNI